MKPITQFLMSILLAGATLANAHAADAIDRLQGLYSQTYVAEMEGTPNWHGYPGDGKVHLIVLKLSPTTAFIETYIGIIQISGIADLQADGSLLYQEYDQEADRDETAPDGTVRWITRPKDRQWCDYIVYPADKGVLLKDREDGSPDIGGCLTMSDLIVLKDPFGGIHFDEKSRRAITPGKLKAIKKSRLYKYALKDRETFLKRQLDPETAAPVPVSLK